MARQLVDDLPATRERFAAGEISLAHVQVIARAMRQMPAGLVAEAGALLANAATTCTPSMLADRLKQYRHQTQPEAVVKEEHDAYTGRFLHASRTIDNMVSVSALLDPETGSLFLTLLYLLMQAPGPAETLTRGQRQADAFAQMLRMASASPDMPRPRGERPQVLVLADLETLEGRAGTETGLVSWTGPMSGEGARRIACDAGVSRVITKGKSRPIDVGRRTRTVTPDQWKALVVRDGGCKFDGCGRLPDWCIAHHIVHWARGGPTDLWNLVLLCEFHHHLVHEGGWSVVLNAAGSVTVTPPGLSVAA